MPGIRSLLAATLLLTGAVVALAEETKTVPESKDVPVTAGALHRLRYMFKTGETVRTKVIHRAAVRTTIDGTSQTAETVSISVKAWEVTNVDDSGRITFVHSVEYVDMKNDVTGRDTVRFDSRKDKKAPAGFQDVARRVGVPLTEIVMDATGTILQREDKAAGSSRASQIVMPLPREAVPVGHVWTFPNDLRITLRDGTSKRIQMRQRFELKSVEDDVATIEVATQVLTPIRSPEIESQLVQHESEGTIEFDLAAGRVLGQQIDLDRRVVGFPNPKSKMHYRTRFTEKLLPPGERTAAKSKPATAPKK